RVGEAFDTAPPSAQTLVVDVGVMTPDLDDPEMYLKDADVKTAGLKRSNPGNQFSGAVTPADDGGGTLKVTFTSDGAMDNFTAGVGNVDVFVAFSTIYNPF
ncbi:MAG: hypothetical protein NUW37_11465, partial [Planctomycetes bacterium]|nr:hypothetical protein [Planctomycetota bacterium]